jgi:hypothetical protein
MGRKRANATERRQKREQRREKEKRTEEKRLTKEAAAAEAEPTEDIDALLSEFVALDAAAVDKVAETACKPPTPRSAASWVPHPLNKDELLLYGGELNNGRKTFIYNGALGPLCF